ncbi:hypothetical protein [Parvularcula marina]|uniref:hypothetical protein n=1 Tax=Parvularcula marina TaxID=2292771 RepID=UPI003517E0A4
MNFVLVLLALMASANGQTEPDSVCIPTNSDELFGFQTEPSAILDISIEVTSFVGSQNLSFRLEDFNCDERSHIFVETTFRSDVQTLNVEGGEFSILFDDTTRFSSMRLPREKFGSLYSSYLDLGFQGATDKRVCHHCAVFEIYTEDSDKVTIVTEDDDGFEALVEMTADIISIVDQRFTDDQFHTASMKHKLEEAVLSGQ